MDKLEILLNHLEDLLKAENEDLKAHMGNAYTEDEKNDLVNRVERWEKEIAKRYKDIRRRYQKKIRGFVQKAVNVKDLLDYLEELGKKGEFGNPDAMKTTFYYMFNKDMSELTELQLRNLPTSKTNKKNKPLHFKQFSLRTLEWMDNWSDELAGIMHLSTKDAVHQAITEGLARGDGIYEIAKELANDPAFSRRRARVTAITEVLTANTASQFEAYKQSPVVTKKKWKHSGSRKITPRPYHLHEMNGQEVPVDEGFNLKAFKPMFPRDPLLPPSERVSCHCAMGPVTDDSFLDEPFNVLEDKQTEAVTKDYNVVTGRKEFERLRGNKDRYDYDNDLYQAALKFFKDNGLTSEEAQKVADHINRIRTKWTNSSTNSTSRALNNYLAELINRNDLKYDDVDHPFGDYQGEAALYIKDYTLKQLKDAGVTHLKVYRGVKWGYTGEYPTWMPQDIDKPTVVTGRAIGSWSMNKDVAENFSEYNSGNPGAIFEAEVPIEQVWGTFDFAKETEVVPLGDVSNVTVMLNESAQEDYDKLVNKEFQPWMTTTRIPDKFNNWLKEMRDNAK